MGLWIKRHGTERGRQENIKMAVAAAYSPEELGVFLRYRFAALSRVALDGDYAQVSFTDPSDIVRVGLLEACVHIEFVGETFPSPESPRARRSL